MNGLLKGGSFFVFWTPKKKRRDFPVGIFCDAEENKVKRMRHITRRIIAIRFIIVGIERNQRTNEPTNQRINEPTNQRTNEPTNQPTNGMLPSNQPTNPPFPLYHFTQLQFPFVSGLSWNSPLGHLVFARRFLLWHLKIRWRKKKTKELLLRGGNWGKCSATALQAGETTSDDISRAGGRNPLVWK